MQAVLNAMTTDILIENAMLLPEAGSSRVIDRGFVAMTNGRITAIGPMEDNKGYQDAEIIDAAGALVMPGLVNTHCHAAMTLFRGMADDLELMTWLSEHIFPADSAGFPGGMDLGRMTGKGVYPSLRQHIFYNPRHFPFRHNGLC